MKNSILSLNCFSLLAHLIWISLVVTVLLTPAASASKTVLKAGLAKVDISPTKAVTLGGYGLRIGPSEGVYAPIYTRSLVFDDGLNRVALIESDVVGYRNPDEIRERLSKATGIPVPSILLAAVHNHSAPLPGTTEADREWEKSFAEKITLALKTAVANLEPVRIGGNIGHSRIAMNRRKRISAADSYTTFDENYFSQSFGKSKTDHPVKIQELEGVVRLGSNPEGPIDEDVGIIRIDNLSGKPVGVFVNYACHGTSLGGRNSTVSPEWMGHMLEYLEERVPGTIGIFATGAAGDINTRFVGGLEGYQDSLDNTKLLGYEIGKEVVAVVNSTATAVPVNPKIKLLSQEILLPRNYRELPEDFTHTTVAVPTSIVTIDEFTWVTLPVELFHEIGQRIKASAHSKFAFIVTYCNGYLGYLPTQKAFSEGGYEPADSHFDPVAEQVLLKEIEKLFVTGLR